MHYGFVHQRGSGSNGSFADAGNETGPWLDRAQNYEICFHDILISPLQFYIFLDLSICGSCLS